MTTAAEDLAIRAAIACLPKTGFGIAFDHGTPFTYEAEAKQYYAGTLCGGQMTILAEQSPEVSRRFQLAYNLNGEGDNTWDEGHFSIWTEPDRSDEAEFFCCLSSGTLHVFSPIVLRRKRFRLTRAVTVLLTVLGDSPGTIRHALAEMEYEPNRSGLLTYLAQSFRLVDLRTVVVNPSGQDGFPEIQILGDSPDLPEIRLRMYAPRPIALFLLPRNSGE